MWGKREVKIVRILVAIAEGKRLFDRPRRR
jgi:hypothetical protein